MVLLSGFQSPARAETYAFSAPPGLGPEESRRLYAPLMELLGSETGDSFVYVHPGSWFAYQEDMRSGRFQLLLDDAHLVSWRIAALDHAPLVKAREQATFVVIALKESRIYSKEDLVGRPVCAQAPPALGTLGFLELFGSPFQVPRILETPDYLDRVQKVLTGECAGAVLARHRYTASDEIRSVAGQLKIIAQTDSYPGVTLTAGPGLPESLHNAIRNVLLSRSGGEATRALRDHFADGSNFVEAEPEDYEGLDGLLEDYPGFE